MESRSKAGLMVFYLAVINGMPRLASDVDIVV